MKSGLNLASVRSFGLLEMALPGQNKPVSANSDLWHYSDWSSRMTPMRASG